MPTPMPVEERVRKATLARVAKARTRRFQKHLLDMRDADLVVQVLQRVDEGGSVSYRPHPDYTEDAVEAALGRR
jgi:hypothetical protein